MNKKPIEDVVKQEEPGRWFEAPTSYEELILSLGVEIITEVSDDDYSGDSYLLLRDDGRLGVLTFGWGSCSGCDSFEACSSLKDFAELRDELEAAIKWFDTLLEARDYVASADWESWRESGAVDEFRARVAAMV